jgi:hypothetical protein
MRERSPETLIDTLERQHRALAKRVDLLERRAYLTPTEQLEIAQLKKKKLATKDQLFEARAS